MKTIKNKIMIGLMLSSIALASTNCTSHRINKGDKKFNNLEYAEAIEEYEKIDDKDKTYHVYTQMAKSYLNLSQYEDAKNQFANAKNQQELDNEDRFLFAQTLQASGNYDQAEDAYFKYLAINPDDERARKRLAYIKEHSEADVNDYVDLEVTSISNPKYSDYNPTLFNNKLYFTSDRDMSDMNKNLEWTDRPFTEMYVTTMDANGNPMSTEVFAEDIQSKFGDGAVCFAPSGDYVYFTSHNTDEDGERILSEDRVVELQIFRSAKQEDGTWSEPEKLSFNSSEYSCLHPAISSNGKWLYFSSNMKDKNNYDLFVASIAESGKVSKPLQLLDNVNTESNEIFPTINAKDGVDYLYFSSAGHEGPGGLDIHKVRRDMAFFAETECLPEPINSTKDDMSFVSHKDGSAGFLSSNRNNDDGIDNIYAFDKSAPDILALYVFDENFNQVNTDYVEAEIHDLSDNGETDLVPNDSTKFIHSIEYGKTYILDVKGEGYEPESAVVVPTKDKASPDTVHTYVVLDLNDNVPTDFASDEWRQIYYEYDKARLTDSAENKLQVIANFMIKNPEITATLGSHADSRGSDAYNMELSEERLESARKYLIKCGVESNRLDGNYYGENRLENKCDDDVECKEVLHQENRRTEIKFKAEPEESAKTNKK